MQQVAILFTGITSRLRLCLGKFLKRGRHESKKAKGAVQNLFGSTPHCFGMKSWTKRWWCFPIVTLYYSKIKCVYVKIITQSCVYSELSYGDAPPRIFHNGLLGESKRSLCLGYQSTLLCDFVKVCAIINY